MKRILKSYAGFVLMGALLSALSGCLGEGEFTCSNEELLQQYEFFLKSDDQGYYFTQDLESEYVNFRLCEELLPPENMGVNDIYAINGKLIDRCDEGVCIRVSEYVLPYCPLIYENNGGDYGIVGAWRLANVFAGAGTIHPSCNTNEIDWTFEFIAGLPDDIRGTANFGVNNISALFKPLNDSLITVRNLSVGSSPSVPYVAYFEFVVAEFLESSDTLMYVIDGSEMRFSSIDESIGLTFFKP